MVEAKRTTKSAGIGQQQAKFYADCLEATFGRRPVIFYTNGYQHWLWDDAAGYPPREVQGFLTRDELELMIQRRRTRLPLATAPFNRAIVERYYQERAIKAVGDAFTRKRREPLLVMATGSGKTRTVIALVDQLMKAGWAQASPVPCRPYGPGKPGDERVQGTPARRDHGEPAHRQGHRLLGWSGVRLDVPDHDQPN